ncbi:MAG: sulfatase [Candidatus Eisenbacteria bacterium]|nr:sulfatase [Candidatus Eisenbacteria bacterium]
MPGFSPHRRARALLVAALASLVLCGGCARPRKATPPAAIFLIVVDTLRPDHLSCYGGAGHPSPAIDRLAASGVRFERAQSVSSWTVPSMGAMLTSRYPTQLGLIEQPPEQGVRFDWREKRRQVRYTLPGGVPTLASLLDDAGYHPAAFVNQPFINAGDGFLHGFAEWCYTTGERTLEWHDFTRPMPTINFPAGTDLGTADSLLVAEFARWLAANADRRPFVWLHLLTPHWPYTPPDRYLPGHEPRPTDPEPLYSAEVREADDLVAAALAAIDARVGLERSLVILTSDHGEEFLDHGMYEHGHSLHREIIHVPLILAGPSLPAGKTVGACVRTVDLLPTILALAGADVPGPAGIGGVSLLPFLRGRAKDLPVYSEGMLYGSTKRSLIDHGYKLMIDVQTTPPYRLFDVSRDPLETLDLAPQLPDRVARMRRALAVERARFVTDYAALVGPGAVKNDPETQRVLRAMRALGYVSD